MFSCNITWKPDTRPPPHPPGEQNQFTKRGLLQSVQFHLHSFPETSIEGRVGKCSAGIWMILGVYVPWLIRCWGNWDAEVFLDKENSSIPAISFTKKTSQRYCKGLGGVFSCQDDISYIMLNYSNIFSKLQSTENYYQNYPSPPSTFVWLMPNHGVIDILIYMQSFGLACGKTVNTKPR